MKILSILILIFAVVSCGESQTISNATEKTNYSNSFLIDVRTVGEFEQGSADGATNIPVDDLSNNLTALPDDKGAPITVFCLSGGRSSHAKVILEENGYTNVTNGGTYKQVQAKLKKEHQEKLDTK